MQISAPKTVVSNLVIVLLFYLLLEIASCCKTGRIFIGSVNETFSEQLERVGIYKLQPTLFQGSPVYKHELRSQYLFYVPAFVNGGFWLVGSKVGGDDVGFSVYSTAKQPELVKELWSVYKGSDWLPERRLQAVCVDNKFVTCSSGQVRLHGLQAISKKQEKMMGIYVQQNFTNSSRPVYKHVKLNEYLFYHKGLWMIGSQPGKAVMTGMFVYDYAFRAEYIVHPWILFNGWAFITDKQIKLTCVTVDNSTRSQPVTVSRHTGLYTSVTEATATVTTVSKANVTDVLTTTEYPRTPNMTWLEDQIITGAVIPNE